MIRGVTTCVATAFAALLAGGNTAQAVPYVHVDQLAYRLQKQTQELHREVDIHFRNTPLYAHLHRDIVEMQKLAQHIHEVAHHEGDVNHLRLDVDKLDQLFHHIEALVGELARDPRIDDQTIRHISQEMYQINQTLHHLRDDLRPVHRPYVCPYESHGSSYYDPHHSSGHAIAPGYSSGYNVAPRYSSGYIVTPQYAPVPVIRSYRCGY